MAPVLSFGWCDHPLPPPGGRPPPLGEFEAALAAAAAAAAAFVGQLDSAIALKAAVGFCEEEEEDGRTVVVAVVSLTDGEVVVGPVRELEVGVLVEEAEVLLPPLLLVGALDVGAGVSGETGVLVDFTGEVEDEVDEVVGAVAGGAVVCVEVDVGDVAVEELVVVGGVDVSVFLVQAEDELEAVNVNIGPD